MFNGKHEVSNGVVLSTISFNVVEFLRCPVFLYVIYYILFILGNLPYFLFSLPSSSPVQVTVSQFGHFRPRYECLKYLVPWEDISYALEPDDMHWWIGIQDLTLYRPGNAFLMWCDLSGDAPPFDVSGHPNHCSEQCGI